MYEYPKCTTFLNDVTFKKQLVGAYKVVLSVKCFLCKPKDLSLILSTHNHLQLEWNAPPFSDTRHACDAQTGMQSKQKYT